jgi:hypothetical protein
MFVFLVLVVASLAAFAFGWISCQTTAERVIISFETAKITPAVRKLKQTAGRMLTRGRHFFEHSRHS